MFKYYTPLLSALPPPPTPHLLPLPSPLRGGREGQGGKGRGGRGGKGISILHLSKPVQETGLPASMSIIQLYIHLTVNKLTHKLTVYHTSFCDDNAIWTLTTGRNSKIGAVNLTHLLDIYGHKPYSIRTLSSNMSAIDFQTINKE